MFKYRIAVGLAAIAVLAGCKKIGEDQQFTYKIIEDGAPETANMHEYEALGDRTFTKTQKYRITLQNDEKKPFHYLIAVSYTHLTLPTKRIV